MARTVVGKKQLLKVEGMAEIKANIERRINRTMAEGIKDICIDAAKIIWSRAKQNIAALPLGRPAKAMLDAQVSIMRGKPEQPRVLVGVSQRAGLRKIGGARGSWSPYWWEFGTQERAVTKAHPIYGLKRGKIKPTPFFKPAVSASRTAVRDKLAAGLSTFLVEAK